jgi:hypothetical protein
MVIHTILKYIDMYYQAIYFFDLSGTVSRGNTFFVSIYGSTPLLLMFRARILITIHYRKKCVIT